jgi:solute carrier family 25 carnitine/acylcarnitine transporter 20/29
MDQVGCSFPSSYLANLASAAIAHPTELIKCKLQLQSAQTDNFRKQFSGPVDVVRQTYRGQGSRGMWKGVGANFVYRTCFAAMFGGESLERRWP